eukprot:scaffold9598_cov86-Isochrysis_galbana.AAC.1
MVEWGATTGQVHGCAAGEASRTARYPPQATRPPRLPEPSQTARRQRAHLNPAQGKFGNVMLRLIRIRSPRVVSTYKWSVVVGVRYDRNSEMTSSKMIVRLTTDTAAPEPVRSLKSSSVLGYTSNALTTSAICELAGCSSDGAAPAARRWRIAIAVSAAAFTEEIQACFVISFLGPTG